MVFSIVSTLMSNFAACTSMVQNSGQDVATQAAMSATWARCFNAVVAKGFAPDDWRSSITACKTASNSSSSSCGGRGTVGGSLGRVLHSLRGIWEVLSDDTDAGRAKIELLRVASSGAATARLRTESFLATTSSTSVIWLSTESSLLHLAMKLRNDRDRETVLKLLDSADDDRERREKIEALALGFVGNDRGRGGTACEWSTFFVARGRCTSAIASSNMVASREVRVSG